MRTAELVLPPEPRSAGRARRFLADRLAEWSAERYVGVALLPLSELVTNAVLHARTEMTVRIELYGECLRLAVADGSVQQPHIRRYTAQATTGRGLGLVASIARDWGVVSDGSGKTIWCEVEAPETDSAYRSRGGRSEPAARGRGGRRPSTAGRPAEPRLLLPGGSRWAA